MRLQLMTIWNPSFIAPALIRIAHEGRKSIAISVVENESKQEEREKEAESFEIESDKSSSRKMC